MKKFFAFAGLAAGSILSSGLLYALYTSESVRLLTVAVLAFLLATITIGGTTLVVNGQWAKALSAVRTTHNHRYPPPQVYASPVDQLPGPQGNLLPPGLPASWDVVDVREREENEIVA